MKNEVKADAEILSDLLTSIRSNVHPSHDFWIIMQNTSVSKAWDASVLAIARFRKLKEEPDGSAVSVVYENKE